MRHLVTLSVLVAALAVSPTAGAGGWASVGFAPLPDGTAAGETWTPKITVLQHGKTPLGGLTPVVTITGDEQVQTFTATETSEVGVYEASVVFPEDGEWRILVDSGWIGEASVTYGPVSVGSGPAGEPTSFPTLPVGIAIVAGLALLAAATLGVFRQRRLTPAS